MLLALFSNVKIWFEADIFTKFFKICLPIPGFHYDHYDINIMKQHTSVMNWRASNAASNPSLFPGSIITWVFEKYWC